MSIIKKFFVTVAFCGCFLPIFAVVVGDQVSVFGLGTDSSGNFIIAGVARSENSTSNSSSEVMVARYDSTGILDDAFDSNGVVTTANGTNAQAKDVAVQSDDEIVIAGNADQNWLISRYNTDGTIDFTTTTLVMEGGGAESLAIDGDGEFIVGGSGMLSGQPLFTLARYTSAGVLDSGGFNSGGTTSGQAGVFALAVNDRAKVNAVTLDPALTGASREYYAGGGAVTALTGLSQFALIKVDDVGVIDGTFGGGSAVTTTIGASAVIHDIAFDSVASPNRIIAVGESDGQIALAAYNASTGALDLTFGSGTGIVTTNIGDTSVANRVAIQSDGKIVIAGYSDTKYMVARYNTDGSLDEEDFSGGALNQLIFGNGGQVVQIDEEVRAEGLLIRSSDQNIVVAGSTLGSTFLAIHDTQGDPLVSFANLGIVLDVQGQNTIDGAGGTGGKAITQTGQLGTIDYNIKTLEFNGARRLDPGDRGPHISQVLRSLGDAVTLSTNAPTTNDLMIFDEGGTTDNVLIVSADNDSGTPAINGAGGEFVFDFDNPSKLISITFLDVGVISLIETFDDASETTLLGSISVPIFAPEQTITVNSANVKRVKVTTTGAMKIVRLLYEDGTSFDVKGQTSFVFDTTIQPVAVDDLYQTITFTNTTTGGAQLQGWTFSAGTFTCTQTGRYEIHFAAIVTRQGTGPWASIRATRNGTEVPGSASTVNIQNNASNFNTDNEFQISANATDALVFEFAGARNGNVRLNPYQPFIGAPENIPNTPVSIVVTITRVS